MTPYLITYDNHPPRNYSALYELMSAWGASPLAQSVWLVTSPFDPKVVRDAVQSTIEPDDAVAVVELSPGAGWATRHVYRGAVPWLSWNLSPAIAA